jgi:hypothetical protein
VRVHVLGVDAAVAPHEREADIEIAVLTDAERRRAADVGRTALVGGGRASPSATARAWASASPLLVGVGVFVTYRLAAYRR